ncbi:glycosyltransferase [Sphingomonas sp. AR_OL41]|uniref:glycosyltransferase family protein n=1 Tax=Sphingomonas sp. AR_OL41 TaxID=3042729 RepID=UPI002480298A|nr:glycosyltransferase [Sphingomonas sp. AR_OL41]MDH7974951.1 glycosyltransferase [Sphingomonas sp. AR_OL41]
MKIIIPNFPEHDNFAENVTMTLLAMGHEPLAPAAGTVRSPKTPVEAVVRDVHRRLFPNHWSAQDKWLVKAARETRADMVLCLTHAPCDEVLAEVRAAGVRHLAAWWGDTPANMVRMGLLSDHWDRIYLKDIDAVAKFRTLGLPAELLHEAMNPHWHVRNFEQVGKNLVVAGSYYGFRQFLVERLAKAGVPLGLYGPPPPRWAGGAIGTMHSGSYITKQEKSRVFGEALACLNSTALSEGNGLNCRAFEIVGACGLQLIEARAAVELCFDPGHEVLVYHSIAEILEHLARARAEPAWAMRVREAGYRRAIAEHCYEHRLQRIITHAA